MNELTLQMYNQIAVLSFKMKLAKSCYCLRIIILRIAMLGVLFPKSLLAHITK